MLGSYILRGAFALAAISLSLGLISGSATATQKIPTNAEIYRMLLAQQKEIARQRAEIEALKARDSAQSAELSRTRADLGKARKAAARAVRTSEEATALAAKSLQPAAGGTQVASAGPFVRLDRRKDSAWKAGLGAVFLRPSHDFTEFVTDANFPGEEPLKQIGIEPGFKPGVLASLMYEFEGSAFDFKLSYLGLSGKSRDQADVNNGVPTLSAINVSRDNRAKASFVAHAESKVNFDIHVADLEGGATLKFGENVDLRLFTGLRFASLSTRQDSEYSGLNLSPVDELAVVERHSFYGAGPRLGGDWAWNLGWAGLSVIGNSSAGVLVGRRRTVHSEAANLDIGRNDNHEVERTSMAVVPVVDMMLGLRWERAMSARSWIEIETGYMVQAWFGGTGILKAATSQEGRTDLELGNLYLDGFFLRGKWVW